ncbi:Undecaprenyl-diphosphatase [Anaeromyxobacter dehalogenans 2CP-1]|uniref:Undecaprenyl-diphosphatase n=1 Tax=Anaeromyxobacter dehalogenans (strain ATCC BAA-258 / DSM 21875 / 2CP-1) TaxID=455488 RepID=UPPP_ANAD2|nr:undecaprenyl-diphosphatase [Anaeromyxobacter dehalogenans]B8J8T6.1 RecName: Full=Undecaprenyl-diphosphatase; AltName: Full=Bacitracin resistance protein; AltName: Full=Undecaprenyl pyrophosphate phosphatase [Anaeromyxobacter dehalogenans 2CP-1]ACL63534.1 Undecaprenyl-diphosphatase [Anaeromyxobacter dehalogenans 2CP-1]
MSLVSAALFGLLQALTEFLPVSSTAHLLVFGELLGHSLDDRRFRAFVTIIQAGTTLAVLVYFRADIARLVAAAARGLARGRPFGTPEARLGWYIVLGTVPAALAGKLLEHRIEALGNWVIAGSLVALGLVLLAAERLASHRRRVEDVGAGDALLIGVAQALALVPGSSRSGTTITGGMLLGFTREAAARFSFLLSVPITLAAGAYKLWSTVPDLRGEAAWTVATVVGTVVSAVAGYLVIDWLLAWLRTRTTYVFVVWRLAAGAAIAALILSGVLPAGAEAPPPPPPALHAAP